MSGVVSSKVTDFRIRIRSSVYFIINEVLIIATSYYYYGSDSFSPTHVHVSFGWNGEVTLEFAIEYDV